MSPIQSEIYDAFRSIGVEEAKAAEAAEAFDSRDRKLNAVATDMKAIKPSLARLESSAVKQEMDIARLAKRQGIVTWMVGFMLVFEAGLFVMQFF